MGQGGALGVLGILQQATGCAECQSQVVTAKTAQVFGAELLTERLVGTVDIEFPDRTLLTTALGGQKTKQRTVFRQQQFSRVITGQFGKQAVFVLHFLYLKTSTADIQNGQSE